MSPRRPKAQPGPRPAAGFDQDPALSLSPPSTPPATTSTNTPGKADPRDNEKVSKRHPHRLNAPVADWHLRLLNQARVDDGIPGARRVRAMLAVWRDNDEFRQAVDDYAREHDE